MPLCCQLLADFILVCGGFPIHVENLVLGAQHLLRITVAIDAPLHQQRVRLEHQRHLIHLPVTRRTSNALADVNPVIEVCKIAQPVNFHPFNRFIRAKALAHRLQVGCVIKQYRMAVHASLRWRNARRRRLLYTRVAVAAIDSIVSNVVLVAELNGLLASEILARQIRRSRYSQHADQSQTAQKNSGEQTEARDKIRAAVKNLGHVVVALWR